jgi:hypothetical protein
MKYRNVQLKRNVLQHVSEKLYPPLKSPLRPLPKPREALSPINNILYWRSPGDWNADAQVVNAIANAESGTMTTIKKPDTASLEQSRNPCELIAEVKEMARANVSLALAKLKVPIEEVMDLQETQRTIEEKQRWMLSVLHHLDRNNRQSTTDSVRLANWLENVDLARKRKLLAAHEPRCNYPAC